MLYIRLINETNKYNYYIRLVYDCTQFYFSANMRFPVKRTPDSMQTSRYERIVDSVFVFGKLGQLYIDTVMVKCVF